MAKRLAISAMAWPYENEKEGRALALELGVEGIELPMNRISSDVYGDGRTIIPAVQALVINQEFDTPFDVMYRLREAAFEAWKTSTKVCVFGSPLTRKLIGKEGAKLFLQSILPKYERYNMTFALEPLPEAAFGDTLLSVMHLYWDIQSPSLKVNIDTASLADDRGTFLPKRFDDYPVAHVHLSEPGLAPLGTTKKMEKLHPWFAGMLQNYNGWVSIEQKATENWRDDMKRAVEFARKVYVN